MRTECQAGECSGGHLVECWRLKLNNQFLGLTEFAHTGIRSILEFVVTAGPVQAILASDQSSTLKRGTTSARFSEQARHGLSGTGHDYLPLATARSRVEERGLTEELEHAAPYD
jgi:hypothetical protein